MIKFETKVRYNGLATYGIVKFKEQLRLAHVPFADISAEYGKWERRYFVLWFNEQFEEQVFARVLDGKLQKVILQCAKNAGFDCEDGKGDTSLKY